MVRATVATLAAICALGASVVDVQYLQIPDPPPPHGHIWEPSRAPGPKLQPVYLVTAYCHCPICCGQWADGITATGAHAIEGVTVAADPRILPMGACLQLWGVGQRIVQDTGSAIQGARIDLYMTDHERALEWGVRWIVGTVCPA